MPETASKITSPPILDTTGQKIVQALGNLRNTDASLTAPGKPADAKAVGEHFNIQQTEIDSNFTIIKNILNGIIPISSRTELNQITGDKVCLFTGTTEEQSSTNKNPLKHNHWYYYYHNEWQDGGEYLLPDVNLQNVGQPADAKKVGDELNFLYSILPEEYDVNKSYVDGDIVRYQNRIYRRLIKSDQGNQAPPLNPLPIGETKSPTYWTIEDLRNYIITYKNHITDETQINDIDSINTPGVYGISSAETLPEHWPYNTGGVLIVLGSLSSLRTLRKSQLAIASKGIKVRVGKTYTNTTPITGNDWSSWVTLRELTINIDAENEKISFTQIET